MGAFLRKIGQSLFGTHRRHKEDEHRNTTSEPTEKSSTDAYYTRIPTKTNRDDNSCDNNGLELEYKKIQKKLGLTFSNKQRLTSSFPLKSRSSDESVQTGLKSYSSSSNEQLSVGMFATWTKKQNSSTGKFGCNGSSANDSEYFKRRRFHNMPEPNSRAMTLPKSMQRTLSEPIGNSRKSRTKPSLYGSLRYGSLSQRQTEAWREKNRLVNPAELVQN